MKDHQDHGEKLEQENHGIIIHTFYTTLSIFENNLKEKSIKKMIPIYKPYLKKYKKSVFEAIDSEWISNHGIYIELATEKIKKILNVKYCILMNNGTSATHCLFKSLKYKYPNINKIYVPNNVFVSPWNCALMEYDKIKLEVTETDKNTFNMNVSEEYIKSLELNSAVLIVHNLGNIINIPRLKRLRPDLIFVEDNCEGLFGKYENMYSGTSNCSLCSSVSFYGNKTITTGEGGAFFTNDLELYKYMNTYYSHGMSNIRYVHDIQGTNYRMTNIQASLLYEQLNDIEHILKLKNDIYDYYKLLFSNNSDIFFIFEQENNTQHSKWMFSLLVNNRHDNFYDNFEKYMSEKNIQIRPLFYDIRVHAHLSDIFNKFENIYNNNGFMLPSYPELTRKQQEYIYNCVVQYFFNNV